MEKQCRNCGESIFPHDTTCWHCGAAVTPTADLRPKRVRPAEAEREPLAPGRILAYGGLALVILIALWAVMGDLGQRPTVAVRIVDETEGWLNVTDAQHGFMVDVPAGWENQFADDINLAAERLLINALRPWSDLVEDFTLLMVSTSLEGTSSALVIARSERLARLTPRQVVTAVETETFAGLERETAAVTANAAAQDQAALRWLHRYNAGEALHCFQRFAVGEQYGYVAAVCAPAAESAGVQERITDILESFTLLDE